jgi:hypothetical protein
MSKGMPPDQAIQYVKSMAMQGVAPLTDLYAMMKQLERLKQPKAQAPQTPPTIRDQLNMLEQQQQMQAQGGMPSQMPQQMPPEMAQGLGGINAGTMENPSFAGGGIVAFQDGGDVVAFQNQGLVPEGKYEFNSDLESDVPSYMTSDMDIVSFVRAQIPNFDSLSPEQKAAVLKAKEPEYVRARQARLKLRDRGVVQDAAAAAPTQAPADQQLDFRNQNMAFAAPNPFDSTDKQLGDVFSQKAIRPADTAPAAEKPRAPEPRRETAPKADRFADFRYEKPDLAAIRSEREERQRTQKTGAYSQADADLAAYIDEQKKQGGDTKEAYRNFWVMTGASLMANKSPNFLQALGESVKENYGGLVKDLKQLKDDTKAYRLEEIRLRQAKERALETGDAADQSRYDSLLERHDNRQYEIFKTELGIEQTVLGRQHDFAVARLRAAGDNSQADRLMNLWRAARAEKDPALRRQKTDDYNAELAATEQVMGASTATGVGANIRAQTAAQERVTDLAKNNPNYRRLQRIADTSEDENERLKALEAMRVIEQQTLGTMGAGPRVDQGMSGGAYTGPYPGFKATLIE